MGADVTTFLRAHWPVFAALALGLCLGWVLFHPREAAVREKLDEHIAQSDKSEQNTRADVGGWTRETFEFAPGLLHCPQATASEPHHSDGVTAPLARPLATAVVPGVPTTGQLLSLIVERHDPTVIAVHRTDIEQASDERHLDLTIAPPALPRWAVQVGVEDVLGARGLRLAGRMKVFGPFWAEVSAVPASKSLGVGLAVEW